MKILILHQHFNAPQKGGAIRSWYLATALLSKGHQVTVITGGENKILSKEVVDGIDVISVYAPYQNHYGFTARINSFIRYIRGVIRISDQFKSYDSCYAMSVPLTVGLAAMYIRWKYVIPYIFEVGDIWPEAPIQLGFIKNPITKRILYRLESSIYKRADSLVALSPSIQNYLEKKNPRKQIYRIPNMSDGDFYTPVYDRSLKQKWNIEEEKFVVSYIGAIGYANGLDYILSCAQVCLNKNLPIQFVICGEGAVLDDLKSNAKDCSNITFIPFQNRDGVREVLQMSEAVLISYRHVPILETGSPNKFFDGLAAGKLIVVNFEGWIKELIEKEACGIYVNPNKPEQFADKMLSFIADEELLNRYQKNSRTLAEAQFSRNKISEQFNRIFLN